MVDQRTMHRLLLAKEMWKRGDRLSRTGSPVDNMVSLHHLHLAVETVLRAIAIEYDVDCIKEDRDPGFTRWINLLRKPLKSKGLSLPYVPDIKRLNEHRNLTQHHAEPVSDAVLEESRVFTHRFLKETFKPLFSIEFRDIDDLYYVVDEKLRELIRIAREISEQDDASTVWAVGILDLVFQLAYSSWPKYFSFAQDPLSPGLALLASGVNLIDLQRFQAMAPTVRINAIGTRFQMTSLRQFNDPEMDYKWAEGFVVDTILGWQERDLGPHFVGDDSLLEEARKRLNEAQSRKAQTLVDSISEAKHNDMHQPSE